MPLSKHSTLTQFLIEERRRFPGASGDFNALLLDVALACKAIARVVAFGELGGLMGKHAPESGGSLNVQGEIQQKLDVLSNEVFIRRTEWAGHLAGMASEEPQVFLQDLMSKPYKPSEHDAKYAALWIGIREKVQ